MLVCQGRAVADGRIGAGTFADPVARDLLDPPERAVVDALREGRVPGTGADRMAWEMVRQTGLGMVPRTVAIDRAVREGGHQQVVLLGAGLDARAWRMPELASTTVWEVDHPASQQDMRRRVGDRPPVAAHVVWVPVDLASEPLAAPLESAGFDRHQPSTWVWEGVVPYLTAEQVAGTLTRVGALAAPGSRLVVNYQQRSWVASTLRRVMRGVLRLARQPDPLHAEPWRSLWTPEQLSDLLGRNGFRVLSDDDLLTLADGLELTGANTGSLRNGRVAVAGRT